MTYTMSTRLHASTGLSHNMGTYHDVAFAVGGRCEIPVRHGTSDDDISGRHHKGERPHRAKRVVQQAVAEAIRPLNLKAPRQQWNSAAGAMLVAAPHSDSTVGSTYALDWDIEVEPRHVDGPGRELAG